MIVKDISLRFYGYRLSYDYSDGRIDYRIITDDGIEHKIMYDIRNHTTGKRIRRFIRHYMSGHIKGDSRSDYWVVELPEAESNKFIELMDNIRRLSF